MTKAQPYHRRAFIAYTISVLDKFIKIFIKQTLKGSKEPKPTQKWYYRYGISPSVHLSLAEARQRGKQKMTEQTRPEHEDQQQDENEALLANMDTATAAHLRHLRAHMEAKAAGGAEKWEVISSSLRELIGEGDFARWFKDVRPALSAHTNRPPHLRLAFPNAFIRDWIEAHYSVCIRALWERLEPTGTLELAIQPATDPADVTRKTPPAKVDKIIPFPAFPTETRPIVNLLVRSALFAAIQGKDRRWLQDEIIFSSGNTVISFTGEQLNQDDHDVLMQLAAYAGGHAPGEYIPLPVHTLLKDLGRGTSGKEHRQADAEIKRLKKAIWRLRPEGLPITAT